MTLILVIAGALRIQHLRADPPILLPSLGLSAGDYFDEGIYCHNARNKILFGRWITDEWNPIIYNAPLTLIYYVGFKLFGVSIITVKAINILFGLLTIFFFHAALRAYLAPGQALALSALFALDYYNVMYNRLGLLENFSCFCFVLTFYLFIRSNGRSTTGFFLGLVATMTALSKYLFVYFFFATLLAVMDRARRHSNMKLLLSFLTGGMAVVIPWFLGVYRPFRSSFSRISSGWGMLALPHSLRQCWRNLIQNPLPKYLAMIPIVALLLILFVGLVLTRTRRLLSKENNDPSFFLFLWIAGAALAMGILNYRPTRYYLPLIPGLYLAIAALIKNRDAIIAEKGRFWALTLIPALLGWPFFRHLAFRPSPFFVLDPILRGLSVVSMAGAALYFVMPSKKWKTHLEMLVLVVMVGSSLFLYDRTFYKHPTYNLEVTSRYLQTLPRGSVVMGQEAPRLALETQFKAIMAFENWFNDRDPFVRYKPTHLLVLHRFGDMELGWIRRRFPATVRGLREIRRFRIWDTTLSLYAVPESPIQ